MLLDNKTLKDKRYSFAKIGLACAVMMFIIMLPSMIQNHGIFIILGAPYNAINTIFSLNSICLLFPQSWIPYAVTYMHIIRIALIGITSFAYLRYMVKEEKNAFLGAILYTFSSYTFVSFEFMQFLEAVWAFPLLLLAVEKMFRGEKYRHQLIIASFLSGILSFYFFVFSTISFAVYFLCRFFLSDEWRNRRKIGFFALAVLEYALGFLCALIVIVPYIYNMFNSSGSVNSVGSDFSIGLFIADTGFFARLFSFFMPAASNRFNTFGYSRGLTRAAYVPIFSIAFVVALLFNKKQKNKKWIITLSIVSAIFIAWSAVSLFYNMLSSTYTRFSYAMILFFVVATLLFLENYDDKAAKKGFYITVGTLGALFAIYYVVYYFLAPRIHSLSLMVNVNEGADDVSNMLRKYIVIVAACMFILLFAFIKSKKIRKHIIPVAMGALTLYGCSYTSVNLNDTFVLDYYTQSSITLSEQVDKYFIDKPEFEQSNDYRIDHSKHLRNYAYATTQPSITVFESTKQTYTSELAINHLDMFSSLVTVFPDDSTNELRTLLGVKYYYDLYPADELPVPEGFTYLRTEDGIDVYENESFIGLGFSYDNYITRSEYEAMGIEGSAASLMLNTLVVEDKDEKFVSDILKKYEDGYTCTDRISVDSFETSSSGFSATVTADESTIIFVSVPYEDNGWTAEINGEEAEFIKANIGCIAFKVEAGESNIVFSYKSPSFNISLLGSCVGIAATAAYVIIYHLIKKKKSINNV